jgi:hypothetical protein
MDQRTIDPAAIEAEVDEIKSLGIDALRARWRLMFGATPPKGLTKSILGYMIAYRIQEEAFGGLDKRTVRLLDIPLPAEDASSQPGCSAQLGQTTITL